LRSIQLQTFKNSELVALLQEEYSLSKSEAMPVADFYNPWLRFLAHLHMKVHAQEWNMLGVTVGLPRSGKSIFTAFMMKLLNWDYFDMKRDVVYKYQHFSARLEEVDHIGETIIWDEAGVGMPAREWYKIQNREIGKMLQTVGHMRPFVFFVSPDLSFIDSQPKKLFHYFFECENRMADYVSVKPFRITVWRRIGKIAFIYPKFYSNGISRIKRVKFYKPPEDFIEEYKEHSTPKKKEMRSKSQSLMETGDVKKLDLGSLKEYIISNKNVFADLQGRLSWKIIYTYFKDILGGKGAQKRDAELQAQMLAMQCEKEITRRAMQDVVRGRQVDEVAVPVEPPRVLTEQEQLYIDSIMGKSQMKDIEE